MLVLTYNNIKLYLPFYLLIVFKIDTVYFLSNAKRAPIYMENQCATIARGSDEVQMLKKTLSAVFREEEAAVVPVERLGGQSSALPSVDPAAR